MISLHDLPYLYYVFCNIRADAAYEKNLDVLQAVLGVLRDTSEQENFDNRIPNAIAKIPDLNRGRWGLTYHWDRHGHHSVIRDKLVINVLTRLCEAMISALQNRNFEKAADLADAGHNLPRLISENKLTIPRDFWENEIKYYRRKWDPGFLGDEEKTQNNTKNL